MLVLEILTLDDAVAVLVVVMMVVNIILTWRKGFVQDQSIEMAAVAHRTEWLKEYNDERQCCD